MRQITIPGTPLVVSQVGLGSVPFGTTLSERDAFGLLDAFVAAGGNFVDSARVYASWLPGGDGASERTLGNWLRKTGLRSEIVVATKGAHPDLKTMHLPRMSPEDIAHDLDASLHHLQTDVIDLYWLHRDAPDVPVGEIIEAVNVHLQAGRIRCLGCSNWQPARIQAANDYARSHGLAGFAADQPMWSLAAPNVEAVKDKTLMRMDDAGREFHRHSGMAVMPYTSQAKGYFTKRAAGTLTAKDREQYGSALNDRRYERAQVLAARHGVSLTAVALSYLTSHSFPVVPVIGARTLDQLQDCLESIDFRLTPDDLMYLEGSA